MNNELLDKCKELNALLKQEECVQEYSKYAKLLEDPKYINLENEIKYLQHELVNANHNEENLGNLKDRLNALHDEYFNSPVVSNYAYLLEEVNSLYQYVNDYINGAIQH